MLKGWDFHVTVPYDILLLSSNDWLEALPLQGLTFVENARNKSLDHVRTSGHWVYPIHSYVRGGGGGKYELYSCLPNTCNINYEVFGSERLYFAYNLRGVVGCGGGLSGVPPLCSFYFTVSSLNELASKLYIYKWKESPLLYKQTPYVYSNR